MAWLGSVKCQSSSWLSDGRLSMAIVQNVGYFMFFRLPKRESWLRRMSNYLNENVKVT